jgi:fructose-1,6-bisphosphatase I
MIEINSILGCIKESVIEIHNILKNTNPAFLCNQINNKNASNDDVINVDLLTNKVLINNLKTCQEVRTIASEENDSFIETEYKDAKYMVAFDPLDGSKNLEVNVTTGTIFCIYQYVNGSIQTGRNIVCAGYSLYGTFTQLLISSDNGTRLYNLFNDEFELTKNITQLPEKEPFYSINQGYANIFLNKNINKYLEEQHKVAKSLRFVGSMVADVHRAIIKGGNFMYPANENNKEGRLRLIYEVYPMSYIFEKLNGVAITDENEKILDLEFPKDNVHQKCPVLLLNQREYNKYFCN